MRALALGRYVEVVIEAVGLVVKLEAAGLAGFEHATEEGKKAVFSGVGQAREEGLLWPFRLAKNLLAGGIEVVEGEVR